MKPYITLIMTFCFYFLPGKLVHSQHQTSFEKEAFERYSKDSIDAYDLLNAINFNQALYERGKKRIDEHINKLRAKKIQKKSLKKQIQTIYKITHAQFFRKYEMEAYFNNIFENGTYNCVTASALYALIFDAFDINYSIKETPSHVYLIADTSGQQTLIESTLPGSGVVTYNDKFKREFVEYLNTQKIISDDEFKTSTTQQLFKRYYTKDKSINLYQLAAIQYYNKGVFLMLDQKYSGAIIPLKKAASIYPSTNVNYNYYTSLKNALVIDYKEKTYDGQLFGQLIESSKKDSSMVELISGYFHNISLELCIQAPDINRYKTFYKDIQSETLLEDIPASIRYKYHYYLAYHNKVSDNLPIALSEIRKAYNVDRNNLLAQDLAKNIIGRNLAAEKSNKKRLDSLEKYFTEFPFLTKSKGFQHDYVLYYMKIISEGYMYEAPKEGEEYYVRFLRAMDRYNIQHFDEEHIVIGLGVMAGYYSEEKNNYTKALSIIDKAIQLVPESLKLKQIKKEIKQDQLAKARYKKYSAKSSSEIEIVYPSEREIRNKNLNDKVNEHFPGKWKATSIVIEDMEQKLNAKEVFQFIAKKNKDCTYIHNGKTEKGKWAYRIKSKCIYFVPDHDKDQYKVFRVKEVSENKLVIRPYKDQKTPSPYKYILKPIK